MHRVKKGHKDLESEDKQIMLDMIKCRLARELQREGWQAGKANALCSRKNVHEQGEIGFVKASISHIVTGIERHSNDSLKQACEPQGGTQMAVFREVMWEQVARVRHSLEARTKRDI